MNFHLILFFLLVFPVPGRSLDQGPVADPNALETWARSARWQNLLHMRRPSWGKRGRSRIKEKSKYFLSDQGAFDPVLELRESLRVFRNPEKFLAERGQHPSCVFPARWRILRQAFEIPEASRDCPSLHHWRRLVTSQEISIVFAAHYMSGPGSMMGHTFLKFTNLEQQDFLNSTVGYAAQIPEDVGVFTYAYSGMFGGFKGSFAREPYYEKVHEYNNMERRDLWEFVVELDSEQRSLFIDHLWEIMNEAEFDYFFLDENCAYLLLALIQVVAPEKNILEHGIYVLPAETAKTLDRAGMIKEVRFRPSLQNKMTHKYKKLSSEVRQKVVEAFYQRSTKEISRDPIALEVLLEKISLERQIQLGQLTPELADLEKTSLIQRSELPVLPPLPNEVPPSILRSHHPRFFELGWARSTPGQDQTIFVLRPAVHKKTDSDIGYLRNSDFNLFELEWRASKGSDVELYRFVYFEFGVSEPYHLLSPAYSWTLKAEFERRQDLTYGNGSIQSIEGGWGFTFQDENEKWDFIPLIYADGEVGDSLPNGDLWFGLRLSIVLTPHQNWKWLGSWSYQKDLLENEALFVHRLQTEIRYYQILPQWDFGLEAWAQQVSNIKDSDQLIVLKMIRNF